MKRSCFRLLEFWYCCLYDLCSDVVIYRCLRRKKLAHEEASPAYADYIPLEERFRYTEERKSLCGSCLVKTSF